MTSGRNRFLALNDITAYNNINAQMLNLDKFIAECVTERPRSMFIDDIDANRDVLSRERYAERECL